MKTKLKKLSYWAGVSVVGIVMGLSLQFTRAWVEPTIAPPGGNIGAPINTGSSTQTKTGPVAFNGATAMAGIGVFGTGTTSGGWFYGDGLGSGNALTIGTYGTGKALSAYEGTSFFEDAVGIGEGTTTISAGLLLDVHGKVGASEYCDQNGANCKAATSLGGPKYQIECIEGMIGGTFGGCIRMNVQDGSTEAKGTTSWALGGWSAGGAPFTASTPGYYSLSCTPGVSGGNFPWCCRTDAISGTTECKRSNSWGFTTWTSAASAW